MSEEPHRRNWLRHHVTRASFPRHDIQGAADELTTDVRISISRTQHPGRKGPLHNTVFPCVRTHRQLMYLGADRYIHTPHSRARPHTRMRVSTRLCAKDERTPKSHSHKRTHTHLWKHKRTLKHARTHRPQAHCWCRPRRAGVPGGGGRPRARGAWRSGTRAAPASASPPRCRTCPRAYPLFTVRSSESEGGREQRNN